MAQREGMEVAERVNLTKRNQWRSNSTNRRVYDTSGPYKKTDLRKKVGLEKGIPTPRHYLDYWGVVL